MAFGLIPGDQHTLDHSKKFHMNQNGATHPRPTPTQPKPLCPTIQQFRKFGDRHGADPKIALTVVAAHLAKHFGFIFGFHTLSQHLYTELSSEAHQRADNSLAAIGLVNVGNERTINLDQIDIKPIKINEGRLAHAEIINRNRKTHLLQLATHSDRCIRHLHHRGLRHFYLDKSRVDTPQLQVR